LFGYLIQSNTIDGTRVDDFAGVLSE